MDGTLVKNLVLCLTQTALKMEQIGGYKNLFHSAPNRILMNSMSLKIQNCNFK